MAQAVPSQAVLTAPDSIQLNSPAFGEGELMAQRYTCDGTNASPPLAWQGVPDGTAELVLLCEDPDAPGQVFVHWMVTGLDPVSTGLEEDALPEGATLGVNDFGDAAYGGPCPPHGHGAHRYVFTLIATSERLGLTHRFTAAELTRALQGRALAKGVTTGRYGRTTLAGPRPPVHSDSG